MDAVLWLLALAATFGALAWHRASLATSTAVIAGFLVVYTLLGDSGTLALVGWLLFAAVGIPLNVESIRRDVLSRPAFAMFRKVLPSMSETERDALEAGTVGWEGDLFAGMPDWRRLQSLPAPRLSAEERAFLDGPVETLCAMLDEWQITHELADLPEPAWEFIKANGFFAMIIPKRYGGLEFSAYAHSQVLGKVASRSPTAASIIAVPNSLGPGELLLLYGTDEQKDHYLPRLARGDEIPCFALTGPTAGSDAASLPDTGIVCEGEWQGERVLGMRLTFDKRYITLAPVATVIGLAFRLRDPDGLLGGDEDRGITLALIPHDTPGLEVGRRHFPLNIPFQNGPVRGTDVFVPLDFIVGGRKMVGEGWRMLMECLSVGRSISLPANATGGAKFASWATGAYARVRHQFGLPIGRFEGVEEALARIAGNTYAVDALRRFTAAALDAGEKPAVAGAISKYHATEFGRAIMNDAMDVHGGKGICLGPNNWLARSWQSVPIAITVEGANILTRSLIIFGQGAIRCHPYVFEEMEAARDPDVEAGLKRFDRALTAHVGFAISNAVRSLWMALTMSRFSAAPDGPTRRYYQHLNRFAASFALAADVAMLVMGGDLKRREKLSARLGDLLSHLYITSAVLKRFEDDGRPVEDLPLVEWALRAQLYRFQEQLHGFLRNFPNAAVAAALRMLCFPLGRTYSAPSDALGHRVAAAMMESPSVRARLCEDVFVPSDPDEAVAGLAAAWEAVLAAEPASRRTRDAERAGQTPELSDTERTQLLRAAELTRRVIAVDDFDPQDLARESQEVRPATRQRARASE